MGLEVEQLPKMMAVALALNERISFQGMANMWDNLPATIIEPAATMIDNDFQISTSIF